MSHWPLLKAIDRAERRPKASVLFEDSIEVNGELPSPSTLSPTSLSLIIATPQSHDTFAECWLLRGRVLPGSTGEHYRLRPLYTRDAAFGRLPGDGGPTVASVGPLCKHGALCLSEHADSGVRRRRTDHVRLCTYILRFIVCDDTLTAAVAYV